MVDLSKKNINKEVLDQEVNKEENQVVISKEEPNKEINQTVSNVNLNQTIANKQYGIFELIGLAFKLVNENIGKLLLYLLWVVVATILFATPISVMMIDLEEYPGNVMLIVIIGIMIVLFIMLMLWLSVRTVTSVDTRIESIESKKSKASIGKILVRLLCVQLLMSLLSISVYALVGLTESAVFIYIWLMIQMQVFSFLLNNYTTFAYFEVVAKGENISNSLKNTFTNLFFSKNGIISKSFLGGLLIGLVGFAITFVIAFFGVLIVMALFEMQSTVLGGTLTTLLVIVLILVIAYSWFLNMMYSYLVYMLNEVRDDKVDTLK